MSESIEALQRAVTELRTALPPLSGVNLAQAAYRQARKLVMQYPDLDVQYVRIAEAEDYYTEEEREEAGDSFFNNRVFAVATALVQLVLDHNHAPSSA